MKHTESLKKNYQFRYVYNRGKSMANRHLVLYLVKTVRRRTVLGYPSAKKSVKAWCAPMSQD